MVLSESSCFLFLTAKVIRFSQLMTLLPHGTDPQATIRSLQHVAVLVQITTTCCCLGPGMLGCKKVLVLIILCSFLDSQSHKVQSVDDTVASWYRSSGHYQITTTCCCLGRGMLGSKKVLVLIVLFSFLDSQSHKVQSVDDTVASWYRSPGTIRSLQHVTVLVEGCWVVKRY